MAILETVKAPEQFIVEVNGGYDILFEAHTLVAASVDGQVLTNAVEGIDGICVGGGEIGDRVRVMVRGNPSKVKASELTGTTSGLDDSIILL